MKRATKTSTLSALRSVNDSLRSAVGHASRSEKHVAGFGWVKLDDEAKIGNVDAALRSLTIAEARIEIARDHLYSYRARLVERSSK